MTHRPSRIPYLVAVLGAGALVLMAWAGRGRFQPVGLGADAPAFTISDLQGQPVSLEDHRGRVVLVNIWATWCGPCIVEMPSMQRLYEQLDGQPFDILAVSVDAALGERDEAGNPGGDVGFFAREHGLTFKILHDASGRIRQTYRTTGVPESFLIGKDGVIYKKIAGATEWDSPENLELIQRLLAS
ncbi:MAG: TlpA disulfide reductase family protein [Gammaproteobacteria bacterium]|nr:TlpA disulfide reductase family protein [Gammaproteobacteria bacterium]